MNSPDDTERCDLINRLFRIMCDETDLDGTCAYFSSAEFIDDTLYVDVNFDCESTSYDDKHRKLIDDLLLIAKRIVKGPVIIVARSCPMYFGDTNV